MAETISDLYRSSNGDRWYLIDRTDPAGMWVRHRPNPVAGRPRRPLRISSPRTVPDRTVRR